MGLIWPKTRVWELFLDEDDDDDDDDDMGYDVEEALSDLCLWANENKIIKSSEDGCKVLPGISDIENAGRGLFADRREPRAGNVGVVRVVEEIPLIGVDGDRLGQHLSPRGLPSRSEAGWSSGWREGGARAARLQAICEPEFVDVEDEEERESLHGERLGVCPLGKAYHRHDRQHRRHEQEHAHLQEWGGHSRTGTGTGKCARAGARRERGTGALWGSGDEGRGGERGRTAERDQRTRLMRLRRAPRAVALISVQKVRKWMSWSCAKRREEEVQGLG